MTGTHRSPAPGAVPLAPFADAPWLTLGAVAAGLEPLARQAARTQLELSSLAGVRARAYMAVPETLSRCRTPLDLVQAQLAFWQEAGRQYAETAERLAGAWRTMAASEDQVGRFDPREAIGFPEPMPDASTDASRRPGDGRRAA